MTNDIAKILIIGYPVSLIFLALIFINITFSKSIKYALIMTQIISANIICTKTVDFLNVGDYLSYIKIFKMCPTVESCFNYSLWEPSFTFLVGFFRQYFHLSNIEVWSLFNLINLILITIISFLISNFFKNQRLTLAIQSLIIGFTFPSFLLVSIRAGLAFLLISIALIHLIQIKKRKFNKLQLLFFFLLLIIGPTIHIQTILLVLYSFYLLLSLNFYRKESSDLNLLVKFINGYISKKIIYISGVLILILSILYRNFELVTNFLGKPYYRQGVIMQRTLGIRSLVDQFLINFVMIPNIIRSNVYKENLHFRKFFQTFNLFQIATFILHYSFIISVGIDGFARQTQYNFIVYLVIQLCVIKRFNYLNLLPFSYAIFYIYYTFMTDVSFFNNIRFSS